MVVMGRDETVAVCRGHDGVGRSGTIGEDGWSERRSERVHTGFARGSRTEAGFAPTFNFSDELTTTLDTLSSFAASFVICRSE